VEGPSKITTQPNGGKFRDEWVETWRGFIAVKHVPAAGELGVSLNRRRLLQVLAILGAISAYATIVLGGTVRGMGAGLACPDWPLCNGSAVPDLHDPAVVVEYAHRLAAALTSLSILLTMIVAILWFRPQLQLVILSFMTFAILVTQVAVGAVTITSENDPAVVTIHLALGTATFASALIVALLVIWRTKPPDA
jgi:heme A synthase